MTAPLTEIMLRNELVKRGIDYAIFIPTETGLKKSILDATAPVRDLFVQAGFHDYRTQQQGTAFKVKTTAFFVDFSGYKIAKTTSMSLYRPMTKKGDPRMWFRRLKTFSSVGDSVAILFYQQLPYLLNLSTLNDMSAFQQFLEQVAHSQNTVANELLNKLKVLAKQPLVARVKGDSAVGMAIESALGIAANSSQEPDYKGIEIKSSRKKASSTRSTLFAQVADWSQSHLKSSRAILSKYGYQRGDDFKLYCTVSALKMNTQGLQFKLEEQGEQVHEMHNNDGKVAMWQAAKLQQRLLTKHAETFWIKAEAKKVNGQEWFYLRSVVHTKAPLKSQFIPLLAEGIITMDHLIKRNAKGRVSEKGPLFKIAPQHLDLLFPAPVVYDLLDE